MKQIYLERHGETEWNREKRRQGQLDSPLTAEAVEKIQRMARLIADESIDAIFTSPLGRAAATAEIYADALRLKCVVVDELREIHHGTMAGLTNEEIENVYPGELDRRRSDLYKWRFPDGESYADGDARAAVALGVITDTGAQSPMVVAHEMIGRMIRRRLLELGPEAALALSHPHDVTVLSDVRAHSSREIRLDPTTVI